LCVLDCIGWQNIVDVTGVNRVSVKKYTLVDILNIPGDKVLTDSDILYFISLCDCLGVTWIAENSDKEIRQRFFISTIYSLLCQLVCMYLPGRTHEYCIISLDRFIYIKGCSKLMTEESAG